jgi:uroporphyrinogen decarboxylase
MNTVIFSSSPIIQAFTGKNKIWYYVFMDSRSLVKDTLNFSGPARIPRQLWYLPWAYDHYSIELEGIQHEFPDDITGSPSFLRETPQTYGDQYLPGTFIDEWGCRFTSIQSGVIGEVKEPRLKNYDELDQLRFPVELLSVDTTLVNGFCRTTDRFVLSGTAVNPFERIQYLRGTENVYFDLIEAQHDVSELLDKVHQFNLKVFDIWVATDIDAITWNDDWGAQKAMLISPRLWRQLFKPIYKDYIDLAHSHGKYAFMHSDGYIADIIPDLIEIGLDALNSQLFCMDIEDLGHRFGGKLTFWGEIDRQHMLPYATTSEIDHAVQRVRNALYHHGGVIAQCEFGAGARPENVRQVFKSWETGC